MLHWVRAVIGGHLSQFKDRFFLLLQHITQSNRLHEEVGFMAYQPLLDYSMLKSVFFATNDMVSCNKVSRVHLTRAGHGYKRKNVSLHCSKKTKNKEKKKTTPWAKNYNAQQNSKYISCGDRDETVNYKRMLQSSKEVLEDLDKIGRKSGPWKMHKKLKFDHPTKWYMHKQESGGGCPRGVMVKVMDCGIVVSELVLQSLYYVHFRENTLGKGMNPLILPAMG